MRGGLIRGCKFTVDLRRDVFMFLFNGKGSRFKKGFMYDRSDFVNDFFPNDFFVYYNKFGECCTVDFPVYMFSYVKFFSVCHDMVDGSIVECTKRDFREVVSVFNVKKFC